ncbi:hypothetical protein DMC30DRAFT_417759 [Rhodotorula diobovata]|uniref:DASH complex subunit Hsk3 like-domain-containing protein n=1 Tax=Rhodotorula diobovata TaxID=5288 RepID=A0A5C5FSE3_9BASI|nr:hypothetical protein DMC30DRAFT_417759 [Rhodotorula diobovata]
MSHPHQHHSSSQSATSLPSTTKTRHLQELARQLKELADRTDTLRQLSGVTAAQAEYMRMLGGYHAAWFMASQRIMTPGDAPEEQQQEQQQ